MGAIAKNTGSQTEVIVGDLAQLEAAESRIDRAMLSAYMETGLALKEIRDGRLYKVRRPVARAGFYAFVTFEEYVNRRWDMDRERALQLIRAAEAVSKMSTIVDILPAKESHVRELLRIEDDAERAEVWGKILESGNAITASMIAVEVRQWLTKPEGVAIAEEDQDNEPSDPTVIECDEDEAAGHLIDDVKAESLASEKAKELFTVEEWAAVEDRNELLMAESDATFNRQDSTSIEWAQWSWNPITGCKHDCPYCYARDIATRFTNLYKNGFEPSLWPHRIWAPENTKVPAQASTDTAFKNVFTGSMADLFGRWVPAEWIRMVIDSVVRNDQWNFLFLTKFPQRVHEFGQMPKNAWMGTTVDCQERVANAEKAFAKMGGGIKWLSVEPMLTPLKFERLDLFDWVVIGGASRSAQTPAWVPPFDWVADLHEQARAAGCAVYHKDNLGIGNDIRLKEFPWETRTKKELPEQLKYLGMTRGTNG